MHMHMPAERIIMKFTFAFPCPHSVKPPPEIGAQRIAGVEVGRGPVLGGMSREEVAAQQLQGLQVAGQVGTACC